MIAHFVNIGRIIDHQQSFHQQKDINKSVVVTSSIYHDFISVHVM